MTLQEETDVISAKVFDTLEEKTKFLTPWEFTKRGIMSLIHYKDNVSNTTAFYYNLLHTSKQLGAKVCFF